MSFIGKLKTSLLKTKQNIVERVEAVFLNRDIDEKTIDELEEILITSDIGAKFSRQLIEVLKKKLKLGKIKGCIDVKEILKEEMMLMLGNTSILETHSHKPFIILVIGANGVGKTTTIGKIASKFVSEGKSVVLGAADTFRAAAIEQIDIWANRVGCRLIKHQSGSDPAAVAFDTTESARHQNIDVAIIDTAGRLHTQNNLIEELKKIDKVIKKSIPDAPNETFLVIDATTGQNALRQVEIFSSAINITGIVLTKLDGTAKGGIIFAIKKNFGIPIKFITVGEKIDDLREFNPCEFVNILFE